MPLFGPPDVKNLKEKGNIKGLIKAMGYTKPVGWKVRNDAAKALGEIGDKRAVKPLVVALKDKDKDMRSSAAKVLGQIGDARAVEPLIAGLKDKDSVVRNASARALGQIGDARAVVPLIAALKDTDSYMRNASARALGQIGDARAVEPLFPLLKDKDSKLSNTAAKALGQIGAPAVEMLIYMLKDKDWKIRIVAAEVLGQIGDPRAVEPLVSGLRDKADKAREAATYALGKISDPRAVEPLIAALKDTNSDVRNAAAWSLNQVGWKPDRSETGARYWMIKGNWGKCIAIGAPAVEPLIAALTDQDTRVHGAAVEALDQLGWKPNHSEAGARYWIIKGDCKKCIAIGDPAVMPLIAVLKDKDSDIRIAAAETLGQIGDARAVEPLITALKDTGVRYASAYALGKIGDARAIEPLLTAIKNMYCGIDERRIAVMALVEIYKSGRLGANDKKDILAREDDIKKAGGDQHVDEPGRCIYPHRDYIDPGFHVDFSL